MAKSAALTLVLLLCFMATTASAQLEPACVENSPERHGEIGCSLVENKPLPGALQEPLFWHIDRFESAEAARAAVGPASVALDAHGISWLLTIEPTVGDHHGGQHVTQVALPSLPPAPKYAMLVMSAHIPPPLTSRVHHHSGVEAFFVVDGEQCLETPAAAHTMRKSETFVVGAGVPMRLVATGSTPRKALAVIVYDAAQPPTTRMENMPQPTLVSCK
jgi:quercetin dioxygenase-like cupin family protein